MKRILIVGALLVHTLANATDFVVLTNPQVPTMNDSIAVVKPVETDGYGIVKEICYRGMLFLKHTDMNSTGGLTQVFDPVNGKPVQCQVKEKN